MTRFEILKPEDMSAEQRRLNDANKASGGRLRGGPYWAYIHNPDFMRLHMAMNDYVRDTSLTKRERQIAVLTVARYWGAEYPWAIQSRLSLAEGVEQDIIDAINAGERLSLDDPGEQAAHDVARELPAEKGSSDAVYAAAEKQFGLAKLVDVVSCIGFYSMICCTSNAFDVTPPDDAPQRLA